MSPAFQSFGVGMYTDITGIPRVNEHFNSDKTLHICKHLSDSSHCCSLSSPNSFKISDQTSTEYELRIKEGIWAIKKNMHSGHYSRSPERIRNRDLLQ